MLSTMALALGLTTSYAQKLDKEKIASLIQEKKYKEADDEITKVLANPQFANDPSALALKSKYYGAIANDPAAIKTYPNVYEDAYQSFDKLKASETDTAKLNGLIRDPYVTPINTISYVYSASFNKAKDEFTNKDFAKSFQSFKRASEAGNFLIQNGFTQSSKNGLDTFTVLYTGIAAQNLSTQNPKYADSAAQYFTILTSRNIATPDMVTVYDFLAKYYKQKGDKENYEKTLAFAKSHYPEQKDYWESISANDLVEGKSIADLISLYNSYKSSGKLTTENAEQIASAINDKQKADSTISKDVNLQATDTRIDAYKFGYNANKNPLYAYNVGLLTYVKFSDLEEEFSNNKGEGAALKAKRAAIEKQEHPLVDTSAQWLEIAYTGLTAKTEQTNQEKAIIKQSANIVAGIYDWKRSKARGVDPKAYDKYDALYKKWDAEASKY